MCNGCPRRAKVREISVILSIVSEIDVLGPTVDWMKVSGGLPEQGACISEWLLCLDVSSGCVTAV